MCVVGRNVGAHLRSWIDKIVTFVVYLNLFATNSHDVEKVRRQRISTRVFIVVLLLSLYVLTFYEGTAIQTETMNVPRPSQAEYEQLYATHRPTLRCLCSQPFVPYSTFIQISPHLHQVCSSEFISPTWYKQLALVSGTSQILFSTFWPNFASSYFQLLASFCSLIQSNINDSYRVFSVNVYTNDQVVPRTVLLAQAQEFSDLYIKSTEAETNRSFSFIRDTTQLNQFITGKGDYFQNSVNLNGEIEMNEGSLGYLDQSEPDFVVGGCLCVSEGNQCGSYPYFTTIGNDRIFLNSLVIKCFPVESVLSSTLECWYNPDCMALLRESYSWIGIRNLTEISSLDSTIQSRFPIDTTVEVMMQGLFLENWTVSFSYDRYYNTCAPISCTYTIKQQFDLFLIVVKVVAIYGGLNNGLCLLIPPLVTVLLLLLRSFRARRSTTVQPCSLIESYKHPGKKYQSFSILRYLLESKIILISSSFDFFSTGHHPKTHTRIQCLRQSHQH